MPLESRLRYTAYSPHHTTRAGAYSPQHSSTSSSSARQSETVYTRDQAHTQPVYNVGTLGTRLGSTLLSRGAAGGPDTPARSPAAHEAYKNMTDTHRCECSHSIPAEPGI